MSDEIPEGLGARPRKGEPKVSGWSFVGDRHPPLLPHELADRQPVLANSAIPNELLERDRRRRIFVAGDGDEQPVVTVSRVHDSDQDARADGWRIDVLMHEGQSYALPLVEAIRQHPEVYRAAINVDLNFSGHRPEWMDLLYVPRVIPQRNTSHLRRINGGICRPLAFENRHLLHDTSYPWGCIGKVRTHEKTGSGVLVGRNIVATAGHVVPWDDNRPVSFDTSHLSEPGMAANVVAARGFNTSLTGYDWAILKLDEPLGDRLGYMGFNSYTDNWEGRPFWHIVGYPEGEGPFWQGAISVRDDDEDGNGGQELESEDADTIDGDSGGPMFAWWNSDPRIVGVVSGVATEHVPIAAQQNQITAGGPGLGQLIAWGRSNW